MAEPTPIARASLAGHAGGAWRFAARPIVAYAWSLHYVAGAATALHLPAATFHRIREAGGGYAFSLADALTAAEALAPGPLRLETAMAPEAPKGQGHRDMDAPAWEAQR